MSKKRPSITGRDAAGRRGRAASKWEPTYWRLRLFKNTYTHHRRRYRTRNWCVKIQHLGQRRTLSLRPGNAAQAAAEACALYRRIITEGWDKADAAGKLSLRGTERARAVLGDDCAERSDSGYWKERLIHRHYHSLPQTESSRELFVRIQHEETSYCFPLGTTERDAAAQRASHLYRTIVDEGWERACDRFPRELTLAFHWQENPLAWTYTALHTRTAPLERDTIPAPTAPTGQLQVLIAEPDGGLRLALADCINAMDGLYRASTVAAAGEALRLASRQPPHLLLANQHLVDWPGRVWLEKLRAVAPHVTGLIYSVHEDSQELFRATPGGASAYLLRRTAPAQVLDPLRGVLGQPDLSPRNIADCTWLYFKNAIASGANGGSPTELTSLTQREHEVLALLSKGHAHKFIAARLRLSAYTVHGHVRNIFEKLGVHNRVEAVVKYFQK